MINIEYIKINQGYNQIFLEYRIYIKMLCIRGKIDQNHKEN